MSNMLSNRNWRVDSVDVKCVLFFRCKAVLSQSNFKNNSLDNNTTFMCVCLPPLLPTLDMVVVVVDMVVVACQSNGRHDCVYLVVVMVA